MKLFVTIDPSAATCQITEEDVSTLLIYVAEKIRSSKAQKDDFREGYLRGRSENIIGKWELQLENK